MNKKEWGDYVRGGFCPDSIQFVASGTQVKVHQQLFCSNFSQVNLSETLWQKGVPTSVGVQLGIYTS